MAKVQRYVDLSLERNARQRRRRRLGIAGLVLGVLVLATMLAVVAALYSKAEASANAEQQAKTEAQAEAARANLAAAAESKAAASAAASADEAKSQRAAAETASSEAKVSESAAIEALKLANEQRGRADASAALATQERNAALLSSAKTTAFLAEQAIDKGNAMLGMVASLSVLDETGARPWSVPAEFSLLRGLLENREILAIRRHLSGQSQSGEYAVVADKMNADVVRFSDEKPKYIPLKGYSGSAGPAAVSNDGRYVVTVTDGSEFRLWTLRDGYYDSVLLMRSRSLALPPMFSRSGRELILPTRAEVTLARIQNGNPSITGTLQGNSPLFVASFSFDGRWVATGGASGVVRLWNVATKDPTSFILNSHKSTIFDLEFSPNSAFLVSASADKTLAVWSLEDPYSNAIVLNGHSDSILSAAFSPNSEYLASASSDSTIRIWDFKRSDKARWTFTNHKADVEYVEFSKSGNRIVAASKDSTISIWDVGGSKPRNLTKLAGHDGEVNKARFTADDRYIFTRSLDGTTRLWDAVNPPFGFKKMATQSSFRSISAIENADSRYMGFWNRERLLKIIQRRIEKSAEPVILEFPAFRKTITSVKINQANSRLLTIEETGLITLWDIEAERPRKIAELGEQGFGSAAEFGPKGGVIVTVAAKGTIRLWGNDATLLGEYSVKESIYLWKVIFSPDGRNVFIGDGSVVGSMWALDGAHTKLTRTFDFGRHTWTARFSPDGKMLLTVQSNGKAQLWHVDSSLPRAVMDWPEGEIIHNIAFSPDGLAILGMNFDGRVSVFRKNADVWTRDVIQAHSGVITGIAFFSGGGRLISSSRDGTLRIWDLSGAEIITSVISQSYDKYESVAVDQQTNSVTAVTQGGEVFEMDLPSRSKLLEVSSTALVSCHTPRQLSEAGYQHKTTSTMRSFRELQCSN